MRGWARRTSARCFSPPPNRTLKDQRVHVHNAAVSDDPLDHASRLIAEAMDEGAAGTPGAAPRKPRGADCYAPK